MRRKQWPCANEAELSDPRYLTSTSSVRRTKPFAEEDGNSDHLHQSLWNAQGQNVFYDPNSPRHLSNVFHSYIAGALRTLPELFVLYAPNVNSYKRYVAGSWAPTVAAWGIETRTPSLRAITGSPDAIRLENRVPSSDMNPYLGMAATLAGGLRGIAEGLAAPPPARGNAYKLPEEVAPRLPRTLDEAIERFDQSALAHEWFGDLFVDDFVTMRRWEIQ